MTPDMHYRLALQIAEHGISAHHHDVLRYVAELRRSGRRGVALDVAADPSQPEVARERAFGRLPVAVDVLATASPPATVDAPTLEDCCAAA